MDFMTLAILVAFFAFILKTRDQRRRIALLARELGPFKIESLMETLTEGYLRALGEKDPARRDQVWQLLEGNEATLVRQFQRFSAEFAQRGAAETRVSTLPVAFPYADRLFPGATFDLRALFRIHAQGIATVVANTARRSPKQKAFTLSAELYLMQHSCHWFCRSKAVASARLLARHQTAYVQLLDAVDPSTREAYRRLFGD